MERRGHEGNFLRPWVSTITALLLAVGAVPTPAFAQGSLKSRRDIGVGRQPVGAIAVDFDGDVLLDIVTVDQQSDGIGLLKGFGDGTFEKLLELPTGSLPSGTAFADTNGDTFPDLITCNLRSQDISVNLGDGNGNFAPAINTSIFPITPSGLAVGDWNGDGKVDVAIASGALGVLAIVLGDGTGHFGAPLEYTTAANPKQVVTADFNHDTRADLAVVNNGSNAIQIWRGAGNGQFTLNATLTTGTAPQGMTVADFNGDGNSDIVVCNFTADTLSVFLGNAAGGFGSPSTLSPGFGPRGTVAADFNNDLKTDFLVTLSKVSGVGQAVLYLGNGAGGFSAQPLVNTGPAPNTAAVGDFNLDGQMDAVTVNLTANTISVLQNTTGSSFLLGAKVALPVGSFPQGVAAADLNRDGKADVASANQSSNTVTTYLGDGLGGFPTAGPSAATGTTPYSIVADDFNRDGIPDLATANNAGDSVSYLANNGTSLSRTNFTTGCIGTVALASGDISGDLFPDLAVVCETSNQMCTRRGTGASGPSAFGNSVCTTLASKPSDIVLGHLNTDAFQDAAIAFSLTNTCAVAIADGVGGVSGTPVSYPVGPTPMGIASGDVDGDGDLDLVVANTGAGSITIVLRGAPPPPSIEVQVGLSPVALAVADFNLDGRLDVAVGNADANNVTLLLGDGTGHFTDAGSYGTRDLPVGLAVADFNQDSKPDIAVADSFSDTLTILLNQSVSGDPLQVIDVIGGSQTVVRWGLKPGALFDVIRGRTPSIHPAGGGVDLGPVVCLANDIADSDTANYPDTIDPGPNDVFFYLVRPIVGGVPGSYTVSTDGRIGTPSSGGCP
ncbi:MAG TPA: VCBS repeat-containing protein [Candidatus Polarisedimenticolia bacterium]|jgi:hypothetical protein|nr:VCBS repeat-containing protein [Candidatus Polarisedimenticolia bacterium]